MAVNCNLNYGGSHTCILASFHIGRKHTLIGLLRSFYESAQEVTAKFPFKMFSDSVGGVLYEELECFQIMLHTVR